MRAGHAWRALVAVAALGTVVLGGAPALAAQQGAVTPEIADGSPAPEGAYPFAVKFTMTGIPRPDGTTYDSACSGALVSQRWVLTAGHCFHDVNRNNVSGPPQYGSTTATVGKTDLSDTGGHVVDVIDVRQAPDGRDIALAKLATPVTDVKTIPISLATPTVGETLRLAGWGATTADGAPETRLQTGQFTVSALATPPDPTIAVVGKAPNADTSACPYDSGAPYFLERPTGIDVLVSVESTGPDCPHTDAETTVRVDTLANWIRGVQMPYGH